MIIGQRIRTSQLAALCRRLALALEAGVDLRSVWTGEAQRARGPLRRHYETIRRAVAQGQSVSEGLAQTAGFFPPLFCELLRVGEQTGYQPEVFARLADHYEHRLEMRRRFLAAVSWPLFELAVALVVVGVLIMAPALVENLTGRPGLDILGFGLVGLRGLMLYLGTLAGMAAVVVVGLALGRRGWLWTRAVQRLLRHVPLLGTALKTLGISRLVWTMHVTLEAGMELRRALRLSLRSTQDTLLTDHIPKVDATIAAGQTIHEAFCAAGGYPQDFLDTLAVGEQSGKLAEALGLLSVQYEQRARSALVRLSAVASRLVWVLIAAFIVVLIFRIFAFYLSAINEAAGPL